MKLVSCSETLPRNMEKYYLQLHENSNRVRKGDVGIRKGETQYNSNFQL